MKRLSVIILFIAAVMCSCNNEEGLGGRGTICGSVQRVYHADDDYTLTADTMPASKADVFIVYGDDVIYGDDMETGHDGSYVFNYLTPGDYTLFAYSTLPTGEKKAEIQHVTLPRGATVNVPTIYVHEGKAYGTSIITGKVWATYFHNGSYRGEGWAYEKRVYLRRQGELYHIDDVRVGADGVFAFQKVSPGIYEVSTVTEDFEEVPSMITQTIVVEESGEIYYIPEDFNVIVNV